MFGTLTYRGATGEILYLEPFYGNKMAKNLAYNGEALRLILEGNTVGSLPFKFLENKKHPGAHTRVANLRETPRDSSLTRAVRVASYSIA